MRFPRPRYTLAMMLAAMTAAALVLWGVPEWHEYQRRMEMPRGYKAQSKRGKKQVTRDSDKKQVDRSPQDQYITDFLEIVAGREKRDLGIKYELIHADPPVLPL